MELPATVIFDYPSTEALAKFIVAELPQEAEAAGDLDAGIIVSHPSISMLAAAPAIDASAVR